MLQSGVRIVGSLVVVALALFCLDCGCVGALPRSDVACDDQSGCDSGWLCVEGTCVRVCQSVSDCGPREVCIGAGYCVFRAPQLCTGPGGCTAPGLCEAADGVACVGGYCDYQEISCESPPDETCVDGNITHRAYARTGTCDPGTGGCEYETHDTQCPGCDGACLGLCDGVVCSDYQGGCRLRAFCVPVGASGECTYTTVPDGSPCDIGLAKVGVCTGGECVGCSQDADCDDGNSCTSNTCGGNNRCVNTPLSGACDDDDPCTFGDTCDGASACVGTVIACTSDAATCGLKRQCNGSDTCTEVYPDTLTACDDTNPCTYDDICNGAGTCAGSAITCTNDPGGCGTLRSCNGTSACTETPAADGTSCNDGNVCTHTDQCGGGACSGTAISCTDDAGTCAANRACNGTSSCTVTYPGSGTGCDDGNACTYSDQCNGGGSCVGTSITCSDSAGTCAANRACNGSSTCTVSYPSNATACDDNDPCTNTDRCNGSGGCVGVASGNGASCGANPSNRCCNGACVDISSNTSHCGGCGLTCTAGYSCQSVSATTSCSSKPANTSGRCTCGAANSHCPNYSPNTTDGQVCRTVSPYTNICSPIGTPGCAAGESAVALSSCPDYCTY